MSKRKSKLDPVAEDVVAALEVNSERHVAKQFGVARSTLQNWLKSRTEQNFVGVEPPPPSEEPDEHFVEIPVFYRDYSHLEHLYVYPLGDVHVGSDAHARDRWVEWLAYLEGQDDVSLLNTGDNLNCALKNSKSESYDESLTVLRAREQFSDDITKLAEQDKIDILFKGNHEDRVYRATGDCPIAAVAREHGLNYGDTAAMLLYRVGDVVYDVFVKHGTGGGQVGARANRLLRQADAIAADVYVSGHTHSQLCFPADVFEVNHALGKVQRRRRLFISSGSFLNYEGYAAKAGYPPQKIGAPRIRLDGTRKDAHASI